MNFMCHFNVVFTPKHLQGKHIKVCLQLLLSTAYVKEVVQISLSNVT